MKAVIYDPSRVHEVICLKEVLKPGRKEHKYLIRNHATTVIAADWHLILAPWEACPWH